MKDYLLILFALIFVLNSHAQEVPEVQNSLITKKTASWCSNCGLWGWELFEDLIVDNEDDAIIIAAHYSGNFDNPTASAMVSNFGGVGQPIFYLNNEDVNALSSNHQQKRMEIAAQVIDNHNLFPVANTGLVATLDGTLLEVYAKTRFFQQADGEYYLSVYIIENNVVSYQAGQGSNANHMKLLRTSMSEDPFGLLIHHGNIETDTEFDHSFGYVLDGNWQTSQLEIAAIIWQKVGEHYQFVNANATQDFNSPTSVSNIDENEASFSVYPNITSNKSSAFLDIQHHIPDARLLLIDPFGKMVHSIYQGKLTAGKHTFIIGADFNLGSGCYYVALQTAGLLDLEKLIVY